jgi:hypothetical protein
MTVLEQGLFLTGEYLGTLPGKEWTDREGNVHQPVNVRLLVDTTVYAVECADAEAAARLVPADAKRGQVVTLPVFARARAFVDNQPVRGARVDFRGRPGVSAA